MNYKNIRDGINVLDLETFVENDIHFPYCICAIVNDLKIHVYLQNDLIKNIIILFLEKVINNFPKKNKFEFYVHNLNYDGSFIIKALNESFIKYDFLIRENNIYYISFFYLDNFFIIKCSYKLFPISLKKFSEFSFFKKNIFPYKFSSRANLNYKGEVPSLSYFKDSNERKTFIEQNGNFFDFKESTLLYCFNDVLITIELIMSIVSSLEPKYVNIFLRCYSASSFSYKIFFKFFNFYKIVDKLRLDDYSYVKKSFYGGRCEVFGNRKEKEYINFFDFSGMYGQCMLQKFPIGNGEYFSNPPINFYLNIGFHTIEYSSDIDIPVLPFKSNKLVFPNGNLIGTYWYEEIILFVEYGGIVNKVINSYIFKEENFVFKDFVNYFNEFRKKGSFWKTFGKLIINSLYGGFALKEEDYFINITFSSIEAESIRLNFNVISQDLIGCAYISKIIKDRKSNSVFNKNSKKWSNHYSIRNVCYSSIIASKARIKLYKSFKDVEKDGGRVLYCDTDSIFAAYDQIKKNNKIGEIEWSETYTDGYFISPKFYAFKDENNLKNIKIKGISLKDPDIYDDLKKMFFDNKKNIAFLNQSNIRFKKFDVYTDNIEKKIKLDAYDKRIFCEKKIYTQAIRYDYREQN